MHGDTDIVHLSGLTLADDQGQADVDHVVRTQYSLYTYVKAASDVR